MKRMNGRATAERSSAIRTGALMLCAAILVTGCGVKKIEYEKKANGDISYRIYQNEHWLKTESNGLSGGMTGDGKFEFKADGMRSSPSEEFNRTMQTYTTAFVQLAQIAAAAYNPSASSALKLPTAEAATASVQQQGAAASVQQQGAAATTNSTDCVDCTAK